MGNHPLALLWFEKEVLYLIGMTKEINRMGFEIMLRALGLPAVISAIHFMASNLDGQVLGVLDDAEAMPAYWYSSASSVVTHSNESSKKMFRTNSALPW